MRQRIFEPLGMTRSVTTLAATVKKGNRAQPRRAVRANATASICAKWSTQLSRCRQGKALQADDGPHFSKAGTAARSTVLLRGRGTPRQPVANQLDGIARALADRYAIERELGHGGMATVYLARDLKHDRRVAIKVLQPELASAVGSERFLREIRLTAQFNHPHILPLLDSGQCDDFLYYVMPYVEGESLRDRLRREKQLRIEDAVQFAREVADALDYAHRHDVLHRDIKPENILLHEHHAVVADFGIARAISVAGGEQLTTTGVAVGTPQYMSPEQATGGCELDARTDVYSLGAVMYEMLAGEPPHTGPTVQTVIAKLLTERPMRLRIVRDTVSEGIDDAVAKALAKLPADRYAGAGQFADALIHAAVAPSAGSATLGLPARALARALSVRQRVALGVGGVVIAVVLGGLWLASRSTRSSAATALARQVTFTGRVERADISRDGRFLAYVSREGPRRKLLVQDLMGGGTPRELASLGQISDLRWSPTGSQLLVSGRDAGHAVAYLVPLLGGSMRNLPVASLFPSFILICWSPDGSRVAMFGELGERVLLTNVATGDTTALRLRGSFGSHVSGGEWSPNGKLIALVGSVETPLRYTLWAIRTDGTGQQAVVVDTAALAAPRWSPGGDALYYFRAGSELRRVRVARETGMPEDSPKTLQSGLQTFNFLNSADFDALSVASDGARLAYTRGTAFPNLWRFTAGATPIGQQLTTGTEAKSGAAVSPDGRWIAFVQGGPLGADLFKVPVEGGAPQQLTLTRRAVAGLWGHPNVAWSPDGTQLAFGVLAGGAPHVATISANGGVARIFERTQLSGFTGSMAWAPGARILYHRKGHRNFNLLDPSTGNERPLVSNDSVGFIMSAQYSPSGDRVAVAWNRPPEGPSLWVVSLRDSSQVLVSKSWNLPVAWTREGRSIYTVNRQGVIRLIPLSGGPARVLLELPMPNSACALVGWSQPPSFVCMIPEYVSDVWIIEHFDPDIP